jgi:hypothetical protein
VPSSSNQSAQNESQIVFRQFYFSENEGSCCCSESEGKIWFWCEIIIIKNQFIHPSIGCHLILNFKGERVEERERTEEKMLCSPSAGSFDLHFFCARSIIRAEIELLLLSAHHHRFLMRRHLRAGGWAWGPSAINNTQIALVNVINFRMKWLMTVKYTSRTLVFFSFIATCCS